MKVNLNDRYLYNAFLTETLIFFCDPATQRIRFSEPVSVLLRSKPQWILYWKVNLLHSSKHTKKLCEYRFEQSGRLRPNSLFWTDYYCFYYCKWSKTVLHRYRQKTLGSEVPSCVSMKSNASKELGVEFKGDSASEDRYINGQSCVTITSYLSLKCLIKKTVNYVKKKNG